MFKDVEKKEIKKKEYNINAIKLKAVKLNRINWLYKEMSSTAKNKWVDEFGHHVWSVINTAMVTSTSYMY